MNIEYANTIPMRTILAKLGLNPESAADTRLAYQSVFTDVPSSFFVLTATNTWEDTSANLKGKVTDFICLWLKRNGQLGSNSQALTWIKNNIGYIQLNVPKGLEDFRAFNSTFSLCDTYHVTSLPLIQYLEDIRKIPFSTARFILNEVVVFNSKTHRQFKALGLRNEENGFAVRNPFVKANVGTSYLTFVRGKKFRPDSVHIFKDGFDYLTAVTRTESDGLEGDAIILNDLSNMPVSAAYIRGYGYEKAFTWLDNSDVGIFATQRYRRFLFTEPDLEHLPMNFLYKGFKDLNEFHSSNH